MSSTKGRGARAHWHVRCHHLLQCFASWGCTAALMIICRKSCGKTSKPVTRSESANAICRRRLIFYSPFSPCISPRYPKIVSILTAYSRRYGFQPGHLGSLSIADRCLRTVLDKNDAPNPPWIRHKDTPHDWDAKKDDAAEEHILLSITFKKASGY